jgi:hypothetical protein
VVDNLGNKILFSQFLFFFFLISELFCVAQTVTNLFAISALGSRLGDGPAAAEADLV